MKHVLYATIFCLSLPSTLCADSLDQLAQGLQSVARSKKIELKKKASLYNGKKFLEAFAKLPFSGSGMRHYPKLGDLLLETAQAFIAKRQEVLDKGPWLKGEDKKIAGTEHYLFVHKIVLPADSQIEFRGDLHGDVQSLVRWLQSLVKAGWLDKDNPFKIIKDNAYLAFLGDYTDRGKYGAEIMFIIMQLYLHNPDKVLIVRGNHEDVSQNYSDSPHVGVFINELNSKYKLGILYDRNKKQFMAKDEKSLDFFKTLMSVYEYMPVAIFLGCKNKQNTIDFILCNHGGMEPGYDIARLLNDKQNNLYEWVDEQLDKNPEHRYKQAMRGDIMGPRKWIKGKHTLEPLKNDFGSSSFQWGDYDFFNSSPSNLVTFERGRGFSFNKEFVERVLETINQESGNNLWAVFRAHQHNDETVPHIVRVGNGIYKLWPNEKVQFDPTKEAVKLDKYSVWTFNVAPRTGVYERYADNFAFDTVASLTLKPGFDNWVLQPRQIPVGS